MAKPFPEPQPHDPIEEIFEDAYWVHGSVRMGPAMRINRNMAVLRHDGELTLINSVRLNEAGEKELEELGEVKHVVRIGYFHGMDDPYYVDRYGAKFWCQPGSDNFDEPKPDELLEDDGAFPVPDTVPLPYAGTNKPECAIVHKRHGGLLITCDSVQHHVDTSRISFLGKGVMWAMGFMHPANIGPPWRKMMTPKGGSIRPAFDSLLEHDFDYLVGGHGKLCRGGAKKALAATVSRVFD